MIGKTMPAVANAMCISPPTVRLLVSRWKRRRFRSLAVLPLWLVPLLQAAATHEDVPLTTAERKDLTRLRKPVAVSGPIDWRHGSTLGK